MIKKATSRANRVAQELNFDSFSSLVNDVLLDLIQAAVLAEQQKRMSNGEEYVCAQFDHVAIAILHGFDAVTDFDLRHGLLARPSIPLVGAIARHNLVNVRGVLGVFAHRHAEWLRQPHLVPNLRRNSNQRFNRAE